MIGILAFLFAAAAMPVPVTTIAKGQMSAIDAPREVVVRDAAEWKKLWQQHNWDDPPPAIDFSKDTVVGVFLGARNTAGHTVEITSVEKEGNTLTVRYVERRPSSRDVTAQVITMPFHLARVPAHAGDVVFTRAAAGDRD